MGQCTQMKSHAIEGLGAGSIVLGLNDIGGDRQCIVARGV